MLSNQRIRVIPHGFISKNRWDAEAEETVWRHPTQHERNRRQYQNRANLFHLVILAKNAKTDGASRKSYDLGAGNK